MKHASVGDTVTFHYTGTLDDGSEFDSSTGRGPLEVTIGTGRVIPAVEQALIGMTPGDSKTVEVSCDEAYGPWRQELVHEVERARIPEEISLEVGKALQASGADGRTVQLVVTEVKDDSVILDANHPLAGKDLTFELNLIRID